MSKSTISNNNSRGSEWRKWDLHIHTPASIIQHFGDAQLDDTWETYISEIETLPKEIKAIGINDYFFLDGYRRIIHAKKAGRLANIDLILPVVELRLSSFSGHKELRKINFHVIFSNELSPDQIESFFLRDLRMEIVLDNGEPWHGTVCHFDGLIELGRAIKQSTPEAKRPQETDLLVGFNNAAFSLELVQKAIDKTIFKGKVITAVGLAEWDQMRWDGGSAAIKKNIINSADIVFTASPSVEKYYERREQLHRQQVNTKLLDFSDAHFYTSSTQPERLGNVFSWLKADLTFEGLRRVIRCFDDRTFIGEIGDMPPKLKNIEKSKTKYIRNIEIRKKTGSSLDEIWFDSDIPVNPNLVAIIGNQGNGKSALTDIIALCGNTKTDEFSFLNKDKFCDKQNKAHEFEAILTWEDGTSEKKPLDQTIHKNEFERVRYIPQRFFEMVTNETAVREGGQFYGEIKKAIFSHIKDSDRLGCSTLDELIELRTKENERGLVVLRQQLDDLNSRIVTLEKSCTPEEVERFKKMIEVKQAEIEAHESAKPSSEIEQPSDSTEIHGQIEALRNQENEIQQEIGRVRKELKLDKKRREFLEQKKLAIENEHRRLKGFIDELRRDFSDQGFAIEVDQLIKITIHVDVITDAITELNNKITEIDKLVDPDVHDSLANQLKSISTQRKQVEEN